MASNFYHQKRSLVTGQKPGYLQKAYIATVGSFLAIGSPGTGPGAAAKTITTDHTFTSPAGFIELYCLPHKHEGGMETNSDQGALNPVYKHTMFFPGDSPALEQMLETLLNDDLILLATEPDGKVRQIGDNIVPAGVVKGSFQSGTTREGTKGYSFEIESPRRWWYEGDITVATIS